MSQADPVVTRRRVLSGLALGGTVAAGVIAGGGFFDDEAPRPPELAPDRPKVRPYIPPDGAVSVPPPRRVFYSDPARSEAQTYGDLYLPASANPSLPVVVLVHGGGWKDELDHVYMENYARDLASFDMAVWNVEYRRVGSGGGWPTTVADVCDAVDHLQRMSTDMVGRLDLSRVVVLGHSAGGHLALYVAGRPSLDSRLPGSHPLVRVAGCVSLAGVADLERAQQDGDRYVTDLLGGTPQERSQRYADASPVSHLPTGVPVLCMHGTDDKVVLPRQSEEYVARAREAGDPARLELVPGGRHDPWGDIKGAPWQTARAAVLEMVGRPPAGQSPAASPAAAAPAPTQTAAAARR